MWSRCMNMAPSKFDVFMFFTYHFISAKCPNFSKQPCQMAQRWRCCWIAYVVGFEVSLLHVVKCRCFVLLDILANLIHNKDNKLLNPLNYFHNKNCVMYLAKKAGAAKRTRPPDSLCRTRLWPYNDKLDYMNNYPDTSPKQHQTLQLESVKVKLFQCFSWAMYRETTAATDCATEESKRSYSLD